MQWLANINLNYTYKSLYQMVFVKYPNVRFKRPAETSSSCSRFILFTEFKTFFNMACIFNLANIFLI